MKNNFLFQVIWWIDDCVGLNIFLCFGLLFFIPFMPIEQKKNSVTLLRIMLQYISVYIDLLGLILIDVRILYYFVAFRIFFFWLDQKIDK